MARLPDHGETNWHNIMGARDGTGGFLRVAHNDDGTLKQAEINSAIGYVPVNPAGTNTWSGSNVFSGAATFNGTTTVSGTLNAKTGGAATVLVAASNAPARVKAQADYVCDGTADNVEVQAAYDAALGNVVLSEGLFNFAATVNVNANGRGIWGSGNGSYQWQTTRTGRGTEIQWTGANGGGPVIDVGPTSGSAALYGIVLKDFAVYASNQGSTPCAAIGIRTRSVINCRYDDIAVKEGSTAAWRFSSQVSGFTGGNNNVHSCTFRKLSASCAAFDGIPLQTISESTDNSGGITLCSFYDSMFYADGAVAAMDLSATDDLFFHHTAVSLGAGTTVGLELRGKDVVNGYRSAARNIHFFSFFPAGTINVRAGDGSGPSHSNIIYGLSHEDGDQAVNIETGADLDAHVTSFNKQYINHLKLRPFANGTVFEIQNAAGSSKLTFDTTTESIGMGIDPATGFFAGSNGRGLVVYRNDGKIPELGLRNQANSGDSVINLEGRTSGAVVVRGDWNMNGTTGAAYFRTFTAHPLVFWTNNAERFRIPSGEGIDFNSATLTNYAVRLKNNVWIKGRNAANNADINVIRLNSSDQVEIGAGATATLAAATGGTATFVVAASNAPSRIKAQADYVCDGTADDVEINAAIAALPAEGGIVQLTTGLFDITATITISDHAITLRGMGMAGDEYTATSLQATTIRWRGANGGTMIQVHNAGVTLNAVSVQDLTLYGSNSSFAPGIGLRYDDVKRGIISYVEVRNCSSVNIDVWNSNKLRFDTCLVRAVDGSGSAGIGIRLDGSNPNDAYHCFFTHCTVEHYDGVGIQLGCSDTNRFYACTSHRALNGTGLSLEFKGSNTNDAGTSRYNTFIDFDQDFDPGTGHGGIVARGTTSYTYPSHNNVLINYSKGNGEPLPTIETGATLYYDTNDGIYRPTAIQFTGSASIPLDFIGASSVTPIRLANNTFVVGRNAANNADVNMFGLNTLNEIQTLSTLRLANVIIGNASNVTFSQSTGTKIGTSTLEKIGFWNASPIAQPANTTDVRSALVNAGFIASGGSWAASGDLRMRNNQWLVGRNQADGGDVNMWSVDTSNRVALGSATQLYANVSQPPNNTGAITAQTTFANMASGVQATSIFNGYATAHGTISVTTRQNGSYINIEDDASVADRTISASTNASPVEITTSVNHGWSTGEKINIYGASVGALNASWTITVTAANKFTLNGSTAPGSTTAVGTATNRPMYYVYAAVVTPKAARGAGPPSAANCDDVNCFVGYNAGTATATECFYVGNNPAITGPDWGAAYTADAYGSLGLFRASGRVASGGALFAGHQGTVDSGGYGLTLPNDVYVGAKNSGGTLSPVWKLSTSNYVQFEFSLRLPNNTPIYARDATNSSDVQMIYLDTPNNRVALRDGRLFVAASQLVFSDAYNMQFNATTGTKIGTATTEKIGFWNATPVARPSAYTQTYSTADKTHATPTAASLTNANGTGDTTIADVGTSFSQTTLNNNFRDVSNQINNLVTDHLDLAQLVNSLIDDLQQIGLVG